MIVLVSDTSVLIDLERGDFLDACFGIRETELVVPDLLYKRELAAYGGSALIERGLKVVNLTAEELLAVQAIRRDRPRLSLVDTYAFSLASHRHWTLLTGDGELRALAASRGVSFAGVLWLLDRMFEERTLEPAQMRSGLEAISVHPRCRLPAAEISVRLSRYTCN